MANMPHCDIVGNEFEFQSRYYGHFRINTLVNAIDPFIRPVIR